MSWLLGHQSMSFHSADKSASLPLRTQDNQRDDTANESLLNFTKDATPACRLNPFLFNGHLQTFWTAVKSYDIPITYQRKLFTSDCSAYPGTFAVDFVVPTLVAGPTPDPSLPPRTTYWDDAAFNDIGADDEKPMLLVLHGLAGGSNEIYLRAVLKLLCLDPPEPERWEACVVNARGCAMSKITSGVLYNARATWDIRQFAKWARQKWPRRRLFACGFSLGANILVNYLGEEGARCPLDAAVVISNPWNLEVSSVCLQSTWLGLNVYMRVMGTSMRQLWTRHKEDIMKDIKGIDVEKVEKLKYLFEFDRYVQCPTWGWPTEGAYYRDASSVEPLIKVRIPLFAIHARDDPIVNDFAAPYEEIKHSKYAVMVATSGGGHLSWFQLGGERWFAQAAAAWLNKMAKDVDFEALRREKTSADSANGSVEVGASKTEWNAVQRRLYDNPV